MRRSKIKESGKRKLGFKSMTDSELVDHTVNGMPEAYQELADRYDLLVRAVVGKYLRRDAMAAEDACQETFLKALVRIKTLRDRTRFKSWLCAIAHNQALDAIRKRKRVVHVSGVAPSGYAGGTGGDESQFFWQLPDTKENPSEVHDRFEVAGVVQEILGTIPELYRAPIELRFEEDLDYQEISDLLGKPLGTIKSLIHRGKAIIREELARRAGSLEGALVLAG